MCYSKEYSSSDGNPEFFRIGLTSQLAACKTSYNMSGGKRKKKRKLSKKVKSYSKRKTKGRRKKNIGLY